MSPMNVPTSTSMTIPSPWGRSRSSTACAKASPIQARPSIVTATPGAPAWRGCSRQSTKTHGTQATKAPSTVAWSPRWAATSSAIAPVNPARRDGFVKAYIANSSCRQMHASTARPATKTHLPRPTMASANAIAGIAAARRAPRSEPALRRRARPARRWLGVARRRADVRERPSISAPRTGAAGARTRPGRPGTPRARSRATAPRRRRAPSRPPATAGSCSSAARRSCG